MKRTTIFVEEDLLIAIREISTKEKKSIAEVVREAMARYVRSKRPKRRKLSFVGIASSGRKDIAEHHEELLWKKKSR